MCDAGEMTATDDCEHMFARDVFSAMIDAALAERV
jgi:hypothetical protein